MTRETQTGYFLIWDGVRPDPVLVKRTPNGYIAYVALRRSDTWVRYLPPIRFRLQHNDVSEIEGYSSKRITRAEAIAILLQCEKRFEAHWKREPGR